MADLFKKLNVLIRSSINDLTSLQPASDGLPRMDRQLDRDLKSLYARVDDAERYQRELKARIAMLDSELARLDGEIAAALEAGQREHARYLQEQANRARQRQTMTEADLREHERAASELAWQVYQLESALEETRQQLDARESSSAGANAQQALSDISAALRSAREKLTGPAPQPQPKAPPAAPPTRSAPAGDGDDLEKRIQRLSKR